MSLTFDVDLKARLATAGLSSEIVTAIESQRSKLAAIEVPSSASPEARLSIEGAVAAAFVTGFRRVMLIAALLALASAASAWLMIGRPSSTRASERHAHERSFRADGRGFAPAPVRLGWLVAVRDQDTAARILALVEGLLFRLLRGRCRAGSRVLLDEA
jgi:hypothetical protein